MLRCRACERPVRRADKALRVCGTRFIQEKTMTKNILASGIFAIGALASAIALAVEVPVTLSGANEVPPVTTTATGKGKIMVGDDGTVSGSVTTTGVAGTMAHIHVGSPGKNGPVVVPLTKDGDTYKVPAGAKLTAEQMKAFKGGDLYVNVHSNANKGGEVRGQLK
jgi:hypothetical protein